ncbi:MAG: transporter substrate-binding domain-containing protein [Clostridia bacterium]|nr:transporter substrate-binding domain-containing protein [Clostridia bacterium]
MARRYCITGRMLWLLVLIIVAMTVVVGCKTETAREEQTYFLTDEEVTWLKEHDGEITIGYTTDYPPVEFLDNGKYVGFSADYFKILEEKLKIDIKMIQYDNWSQLIEDAKSKKISGITAATKTEDRSRYFNFTVPYILNPNVIITRENFSEELSFEKLANSSMDILVVADYAIIEYLDEHYPKLEYREVPSASDGMRMVSFGEADAIIIEVMSAAASIDRDNISNLIVNSETAYESNLSIATRSDWPMLNQVFNKGLAQIADDEKRAIRMKWLPMERKGLLENRYFWIGLVSVILLLSGLIIAVTYWNQALKKAVDEKTEALEKSKDELMQKNKQLKVTEEKLLEEIDVRKRSEERITYKSYHDELTGLFNRAYYNEQLIARDIESELPLSIILADLNGLKITNDTLGHDEGDKLLIKIAGIIEASCGMQDIVARIGGDEFVILLSNSSEDEVQAVCAAIKEGCRRSQRNPIKPSVALGYATRHDMGQSLGSIFKKAEDNMYENKMYESESTHTSILESLKTMMRETTFETAEHSRRMETMAVKMGEALNLDGQCLNALSSLADLHDLGKVAIPDEILSKNGKLTEGEWEKIKRHPDIGFKIASSSPKLNQIAEGILAHHEHWDGSGYPHGLKAEEIPLISRIISIVDAYDVMTNERPYKEAMDKSVAIAEIKRCSGTQFDPNLVTLFVKLFET